MNIQFQFNSKQHQYQTIRGQSDIVVSMKLAQAGNSMLLNRKTAFEEIYSVSHGKAGLKEFSYVKVYTNQFFAFYIF